MGYSFGFNGMKHKRKISPKTGYFNKNFIHFIKKDFSLKFGLNFKDNKIYYAQN